MKDKNQEWVRVYSARESYKIEIVKAMLKEQNIDSFVIDKKDSAVVTIGDIELYVHPNDQVLASLIVNNNPL
jgi:hypothetical protein